jgi:hypothetical protein
MAILTNSGRAAIAAAIKQRPLYLAWGSGQTWWDSVITSVRTFNASDVFTLPYGNIQSIAVQSLDQTVTYVLGADYTVDTITGVVTREAEGTIPELEQVSVTFKPQHPAEPPDAEGLVTPFGFRKITEARFVRFDPNGTIVLVSGRYALSEEPTNELYIRTSYDYEDGVGSTVRELSIHMDAAPIEGAPIGQMYFEVAEIADPGILLALQRVTPLERVAATRQTFELVLVF